MTPDDAAPLEDAETRMLAAMLTSDVDALDALIADELVFTLPDGSSTGKQADLEAHRTGATRFERLDVQERNSHREGDSGTTETRVHAVVLWQGARIESALTYRRTWRLIDGDWQVVAGSATPTSGASAADVRPPGRA